MTEITNSEAASHHQKVNYGLDAPIFQRSALFGGLAAVILGTLLARWAQQHDSQIVFTCATAVQWTGLWFFLTGCVMFWGSKVGKLHLRDKIIASIPWRGDEQVLDVGCGHGMMLLAAAKQLKSGRAIGIDIWSQADQADNNPESTSGQCAPGACRRPRRNTKRRRSQSSLSRQLLRCRCLQLCDPQSQSTRRPRAGDPGNCPRPQAGRATGDRRHSPYRPIPAHASIPGMDQARRAGFQTFFSSLLRAYCGAPSHETSPANLSHNCLCAEQSSSVDDSWPGAGIFPGWTHPVHTNAVTSVFYQHERKSR